LDVDEILEGPISRFTSLIAEISLWSWHRF
jgi:hypothetical protein